MNPRTEQFIAHMEQKAISLETISRRVSCDISAAYTSTPTHFGILVQKANKIIEDLDAFLVNLEILNMLLDKTLENELIECINNIMPPRNIIFKQHNTFDALKALESIHAYCARLVAIAAIANVHALNKVTKLTSEDESNNTVSDLTKRVTKLEQDLQTALAEIAKLKANQSSTEPQQTATSSSTASAHGTPNFF